MPFNLRGPELVVLLVLVAVVAGVVLLVVFLVKAGTSRPQQGAAAVPQSSPPGWYPLPDGSGRVAWWDGEKWVDAPSP
jgi:hypothetical protein